MRCCVDPAQLILTGDIELALECLPYYPPDDDSSGNETATIVPYLTGLCIAEPQQEEAVPIILSLVIVGFLGTSLLIAIASRS